MIEGCSDSREGWSRNATSSAAGGWRPHLELRGGGDLLRVTELLEPAPGLTPGSLAHFPGPAPITALTSTRAWSGQLRVGLGLSAGASQSPGGSLTPDCWAQPSGFPAQQFWGGAREHAFQTSSQLRLLVSGLRFENRRSRPSLPKARSALWPRGRVALPGAVDGGVSCMGHE